MSKQQFAGCKLSKDSDMWDIHEVMPPSTQKMLEQHQGEDLALGVGTDP